MKGGISEVEVMKIIGLREKGLYFKKISELTGYTAKKVEYIVSVHQDAYGRAFNFPEIIHAPRFGAK